MKHALCLLMILAATAYAEQMKWDDLCSNAHVKVLSIAATNGVKVHGTCAYQSDHGITLNTSSGLRTVARDDMDSVRISNRAKSHCMLGVGTAAFYSFGYGIGVLATPYFILSPGLIAGAPVILAGGAPYCAVHDLVNRLAGSHKITII
jgi:hypothetical protein